MQHLGYEFPSIPPPKLFGKSQPRANLRTISRIIAAYTKLPGQTRHIPQRHIFRWPAPGLFEPHLFPAFVYLC